MKNVLVFVMAILIPFHAVSAGKKRYSQNYVKQRYSYRANQTNRYSPSQSYSIGRTQYYNGVNSFSTRSYPVVIQNQVSKPTVKNFSSTTSSNFSSTVPGTKIGTYRGYKYAVGELPRRSKMEIKAWISLNYMGVSLDSLSSDVYPRTNVWNHLQIEHNWSRDQVSGLTLNEAMYLHDASHRKIYYSHRQTYELKK